MKSKNNKLRQIRKRIEKKLFFFLPILAFMIYLLVKIILLTVRKKYSGDELNAKEGHIFLAWHNRIVTICFFFKKAYRRNMTVIASRSNGGRAIAQLTSILGINNVAGSSNKKGILKSKGGVGAVRKLIRILLKGGIVGVTPDGPRGPRYQLQKGIFSLYRLSKKDIYVGMVNYKSYWYLNTWDRMQIPKPFTTAEFVSKKVSLNLDMTDKQIEAQILSVMRELTVDKPSDC